jgi:hypothetical protein
MSSNSCSSPYRRLSSRAINMNSYHPKIILTDLGTTVLYYCPVIHWDFILLSKFFPLLLIYYQCLWCLKVLVVIPTAWTHMGIAWVVDWSVVIVDWDRWVLVCCERPLLLWLKLMDELLVYHQLLRLLLWFNKSGCLLSGLRQCTICSLKVLVCESRVLSFVIDIFV